MPQIFPGFHKLQIACRLLSYAVVAALPLTFNLNVLAQSTVNPDPSVSQPTDTSQDPIGQKLFGQWEIQDSSLPTKINLLFTPEGNFYLILGQGNRFGAYPLKYRINSTPKPMHLNVILPDAKEPVETIFDFTADGQLRVQLNGTDPGKPRPKDFGADALPENVEVVPTDDQASSDPQTEAKNYVGAMNRANQAFYLENERFAKTLDELQIGIKPETENYRYRIIPQGNSKGSVVSTATAKKPGLKSYTGFVYTKKLDDETITIALVCESNQASTRAPIAPKLPRTPNQEVQCPAGSTSLSR
jgi:hypothetical protein